MTQTAAHLKEGSVSIASIIDERGGYGTAAGAANADNVSEVAVDLLRTAINRADRNGEQPSLVWLSSSPGHEERTVAALHRELGGQTPIYGGTCADDTISNQWWVSDQEEGFAEGVVVTVMYPRAKISHAFHSGYVPRNRGGMVTSASGRSLISIEGQPAAEVYNEWADGAIDGVPPGDNILAESTLSPLGVKVGEINDLPYYRLIHPARIEAGGTISLFSEVEVNTRVEIFGGSKSSILHRAGRVAHAAAHRDGDGEQPVVGALITFCAGCLLSVRDDVSVVVDSITNELPGVPFVGQFTFGEQGAFPGGENRHGNLMISAVLFRAET
jgi:hypothetical protein